MSASKIPSVLVIGAGMYVCGRGTSGLGTILPTVVQAQAEGDIDQLAVAATSSESLEIVRQKLQQITPSNLQITSPLNGEFRGHSWVCRCRTR